jgi:hypothetical protein
VWLCFVDAREVRFPPDPLRWIGAALTVQQMRRQDRRFGDGRGSGTLDPPFLRLLRKL